jgi:hypothetical protein
VLDLVGLPSALPLLELRIRHSNSEIAQQNQAGLNSVSIMETRTELTETGNNARELFTRYHVRYEVSFYFVMVVMRTSGIPPSQRRIHAGFDLDLYAKGANHDSLLPIGNGELRATLDGLCAACREVVSHAPGSRSIEIMPFGATLVFNAKSHFEPEALVRIRITHFRGLDQPAGASGERALVDVIDSLDSLGVKKT